MAKANLKPAMGNVIKFPDLMGQMPHRPDNYLRKPRSLWTLIDEADSARAMVAKFQSDLDRWAAGERVSQEDYMAARIGVEMWGEMAADYEAKAAAATFSHNGVVYAEPMGRA